MPNDPSSFSPEELTAAKCLADLVRWGVNPYASLPKASLADLTAEDRMMLENWLAEYRASHTT